MAEVVAPVVVEYRPVAQKVHTEPPAELRYRPAWHNAHVAEVVAPDVVEYRPTAHSEHTVPPVVLR